MMSRLLRATWTASVLALLFLPQLATAGFIEVRYSAHVRTTTGLGRLDLGTHPLLSDPSGSGSGEPVPGDYTITAWLGSWRMNGHSRTLAGVPIEAMHSAVGAHWQAHPAAEAPPVDPTFLITFTITDVASGESGTIEYVGRATTSTTNQDPATVLVTTEIGPGTTDLKLGQNRYQVIAFGGQSDVIGKGAPVRVRIVATADTPEPGTLALAGIGLGLIGFRLRRRL